MTCPFDTPRPANNEHWDLIDTLSISSLYLSKNQTYRGQCQLIFDSRHVARLDDGEESTLAFEVDGG